MAEKDVVNIFNMTSRDLHFDSYARIGIHEDMLRDEVRTKAYKDAIMHNSHLFKNKIVLDVGCGTGILSMIAAKAGAKKVIAVDSSHIIELAEKIVEKNGFSEVISLIKGKIEDISLPEEFSKVDIIISEWMGYCLLYENMLSAVIVARDKFLVEGGAIFPDRCCLRIAGIDNRQTQHDKLNWWNNVYGFDMSVIKDALLKQPLVTTVQTDEIVTYSCALKDINLYTVKNEDIDFSTCFQLEALRTDYVNAFVTFFTVEFTRCHKLVEFSTSPRCPMTHWRQTVFHNKELITVKEGEMITGQFSLKRSAEFSGYLDISIGVDFSGERDSASFHNTYKLK